VPTSETIFGEGPYAPQQLVGLALGKPTGGQIIVYGSGMGEEAEPVSVSLATVAGVPVGRVHLVAERQSAAAGYVGYLQGVGIVIPPVLSAFTSYVLSVSWEGPAVGTVAQTVYFMTGPGANLVTIEFRSHFVVAESRAPQGVLTAARGGRQVRAGLSRLAMGRYRGRLDLDRLSPGHWSLCVESGGGSTRFVRERRCAAVTIG
jgi:hypothetical protein